MIFLNLQKYQIILASGSPRRHELLKQAGLSFTVGEQREVQEVIPPGMKAEEAALALASQKAEAWRDIWQQDEMLVITADTIVLLDDRILGKPAGKEQAVAMLQDLSGRSHRVITGVTISGRERQKGFSEVTKVFFKPLSLSQINYYVNNYKPFDKAGAYAIQEWIGMVGIYRIEGCYYNVMGLPVARLMKEFEAF